MQYSSASTGSLKTPKKNLSWFKKNKLLTCISKSAVQGVSRQRDVITPDKIQGEALPQFIFHSLPPQICLSELLPFPTDLGSCSSWLLLSRATVPSVPGAAAGTRFLPCNSWQAERECRWGHYLGAQQSLQTWWPLPWASQPAQSFSLSLSLSLYLAA